jgi:ABC-type spermidine/putrescine transport system permease subunit I
MATRHCGVIMIICFWISVLIHVYALINNDQSLIEKSLSGIIIIGLLLLLNRR